MTPTQNLHNNNNDPNTLIQTNSTSTFDVLKNTVKEAAFPTTSSFHDWDTDSLKQLLVENNVQIRGSANASRATLIRICDDVFGPIIIDNDENDCRENDNNDSNDIEDEEDRRKQGSSKFARMSSTPFSFEDLETMNWAAMKIQGWFIASRQRIYDKMNSSQNEYCDYDYEENNYDEYYDEEHNNPEVYDDLEESSDFMVDDHDEEIFHKENSVVDIYEESIDDGDHVITSDYKESNMSQASGQSSSPKLLNEIDEELETAWRKPSWKFAKRYEAENRPHKAGKDMKPYHWRVVTLGRHCTMGGCGEQLDLWDEGATSEFSQFGSGITNYFKFLKWCCWIMFIISAIHIPAIIINILSSSSGMAYESTLAMTTLGNLGNAKDVEYITIFGCNESGYHFDTCTLNKNDIAMLYGMIDFTGTLVIIIGWVWLRVFEKNEVEHLNRTTVDVSDYTVKVVGIHPKTKERELAAHFADITNEAVAEVSLAFKSAKAIKYYRMRGKIMKERINCIQRIRYEKSNQNPKKSMRQRNKKIRKMLKERRRLTEQICLADDQRKGKSASNEAIQGFVTFETEDGFLKAMSSYQLNWIRSFCCYPRHLYFKGKRLKLSQAPEPSTILWENLEFSAASRFGRKCLTTLVASLAILMSIYFTFLAKDFREELMKSMNKVCPKYVSDLSTEQLKTIAEQNNTYSHCYCSRLDPNEQWNEPMCLEYVRGAVRASTMNYGAGFMVVFMNMFFTILMDRAGSYEKHESLDAMESSNMTRVFLLRFLNSGCLVLLYSVGLIQAIVGVRFEDPQNFNVEWFGTGGVSIIIVMCINLFSPHIVPLIQYRRHRGNIAKLESKGLTKDQETDDSYRIWYTQEELNALYLGPQFYLNYRYTQALVNFFICWVYAISMPVLPLIGALSFYITYWVDKFLFCNFYRTPPKYSDNIGARSTSLIGYGILLHIFMSCWILGSNQIFSGRLVFTSEKLPGQYLMKFMLKTHIVPLECLAILFIVGLVMKRSLLTFTGTLSKLVRCLICSTGSNVKELKKVMNAVQVRYSAARMRGVIKGLASYNILQNPKYQEAFAISPEFAMSHQRLSSIRGYNTKEGGLCVSQNSNSDNSSK